MRNRLSDLDVLFDRLRAVSAVRFTSRSRCPRGGIIRGAGIVEIEPTADGGLAIRESGTWREGTGEPVRFRNHTRWTPDEEHGTVTIENLRRGEANAVRLVDLVLRDDVWMTIEPHECGTDLYRARVVANDAGIRVRWQIRGPAKATVVSMHYIARGAP